MSEGKGQLTTNYSYTSQIGFQEEEQEATRKDSL